MNPFVERIRAAQNKIEKNRLGVKFRYTAYPFVTENYLFGRSEFLTLDCIHQTNRRRWATCPDRFKNEGREACVET